jgi:hypothetical protein
MRLRLRHLAVVLTAAALGAAAGCNADSTAPNDHASALAAAQELTHLADSLAATGGDPAEIGAFRGLAGLVMNNGRISTVTLSVDGAPAEFLATAQQIMLGCPPEMLCTMVASPPLRSFMAWQKSDPRRFVQLTEAGGAFVQSFASQHGTVSTTLPTGSTLLYLDGSGQVYFGMSRSQPIGVTPSDTPCAANDGRQLAIYAPQNCTQAEFTVALNGTVSLAPFALRSDSGTAAASHTLAMQSQSVHGAVLVGPMTCVACPDSGAPPPVVVPPIATPPADSLASTLTVSAGTDVTLTFTVTNNSAKLDTLHFRNGQQFDIRIWNENGAALVWRWGEGQAFTQSLESRTLAAGESASYVAHWTPSARGTYRALAYLTSSSHGAASYATFVVP